MKNKRNILFINHSIKHGGPGKSLFYILKYLDKSKLNTFVLIPGDGVFDLCAKYQLFSVFFWKKTTAAIHE